MLIFMKQNNGVEFSFYKKWNKSGIKNTATESPKEFDEVCIFKRTAMAAVKELQTNSSCKLI